MAVRCQRARRGAFRSARSRPGRARGRSHKGSTRSSCCRGEAPSGAYPQRPLHPTNRYGIDRAMAFEPSVTIPVRYNDSAGGGPITEPAGSPLPFPGYPLRARGRTPAHEQGILSRMSAMWNPLAGHSRYACRDREVFLCHVLAAVVMWALQAAVPAEEIADVTSWTMCRAIRDDCVAGVGGAAMVG